MCLTFTVPNTSAINNYFKLSNVIKTLLLYRFDSNKKMKVFWFIWYNKKDFALRIRNENNQNMQNHTKLVAFTIEMSNDMTSKRFKFGYGAFGGKMLI